MMSCRDDINGTPMEWDREKLYTASSDFFELGGDAVMCLAPDAARNVCLAAVDHGLLIWRVEGGIWRHPCFEARLDCILEGIDPPVARAEAELNNTRAADFVVTMRASHSAFVLTVTPFSGD